MVVRCPAKVNTFLSVGPLEPSGFHQIRTEFQAIGLWDELSIEESEEDSFVCDGLECEGENTVQRALRLLREALPIPNLSIVINKDIPPQAGLGGGSSDAAGLIRFVKHRWPDLVSEQFAFEVACAVGSDVPFFLVGGRAKASGYGETLEPLPDPTNQWLVVVKPNIGVETARAYALLDATPASSKPMSNVPHNDFERVAPCESLDLIERLLVHGAKTAHLCGSGSAVFGAFDDHERARLSTENMKLETGLPVWLAPTLTREESLWM